jgi:hypothetical protein
MLHKLRVIKRHPSRNVKRIILNEERIISLFDGENKRRYLIKGLPKRVKPISTAYDVTRGGWSIILEHPSFEPIGEGEIIPVIGDWWIEEVNK